METFKDFENIHAMLKETVGRRGDIRLTGGWLATVGPGK